MLFTANKFFGKKTKLVGSVLFVGDSITAIEHNKKPIKTTYPNIIKKKIVNKKTIIDVLAVVGKNTAWQLESLTNKLKTNTYDRIYIYGGINDIFSSIPRQKVVQNIQKMVDLIRKKGAEAYVIIGYDSQHFMDEYKLTSTRKVADKTSILNFKKKYIDYQNSISFGIRGATIVDKFSIPSSMTFDGIHPTPQGQEIIAEILLKNLKT